MFQKNSSNLPKREGSAASDGRPITTTPSKRSRNVSSDPYVVLPEVEIKGSVTFANDVVIDGKVEGEIFSGGSVFVSEQATVNARIRCKSAVIEGCVNGDIIASERLELAGHAEVTGDIKAAVLSMEPGTVLVGSSSVGSVSNGAKIIHRDRNGVHRELELAVI